MPLAQQFQIPKVLREDALGKTKQKNNERDRKTSFLT